jgi:serine/threonine-protein phosphatase 6 regulatory ankyrin repeat subunit B
MSHLITATKLQDAYIVEYLLEQPDTSVNFQDRSGSTALMYAVRNSDAEIVELLLLSISRSLLNVNIQDNNGGTALIHASIEGNVEIVRLLLLSILRNPVDVNIQDNNGYTALMYAISIGDREIVELLLENGADVNIETNWGDTAISIAQDNDNIEILGDAYSEAVDFELALLCRDIESKSPLVDRKLFRLIKKGYSLRSPRDYM